jgi:hypothetical protein
MPTSRQIANLKKAQDHLEEVWMSKLDERAKLPRERKGPTLVGEENINVVKCDYLRDGLQLELELFQPVLHVLAASSSGRRQLDRLG